MARIRTIKPEFPQSESMGRVSRDARLLFLLLFTVADDEGRTRAASRMLASLLYPYDDDAKTHIAQWLAELEREGCITLYSHDGNAYLQIEKWLSHQKIDHPTKSRLPAPLAKPREASRSLAPDLVPRIVSSIKKKEAAPTGAVVVDLLPDWLNREAWAGYTEMRRKARKPMTPRAQSLILSKLDAWRMAGHDPTAILDNSTANSWTDVYEPKGNRNDNRKSTAHDTFIGAGASLARDYLAADGQGSGDGGADAVQAGRPLLSP